MFIVTHTKKTSLNTDYVVALELVRTEQGKPAVGAIMENNKQLILADYDTAEECLIAIDYVSFCVNKKNPILHMPTKEQIRFSIRQASEGKKTPSVTNQQMFSCEIKATPDIQAFIKQLFEGETR